MTLHILPDLEQGSEAWHDQRRGIVTASVVGRLISTRHLTAIDYDCPECGADAADPCVSKRGATQTSIKSLHTGRAQVARDADTPPTLEVVDNDESRGLTLALVAERIAGWTEPTFVSNDMFRGTMAEPIARDAYSEHFAPVTEVGFMRRDEGHWTLGYSPDGLVGDDGLIEIKSPRAKEHVRTILADEVPERYMPQCQAGLLVSGRKWLDYVSFCGGLPLFVKRVYPDPAWHVVLRAACLRFEQIAAEMVAAYNRAVVGLPMTERVDLDMEMNFQ